jgi:hypothetical protein
VKLIESQWGLDVRDASFQRLGKDLEMVEIRLNIAFSSKARYFEFERELDRRGDCHLMAASSGT